MDKILLSHGGGGQEMNELINETIFKAFDNEILRLTNDSAILKMSEFDSSEMAFTTDSFVVKPLFFPGGDIGKIAVCGTINDLAMVGAEARYLSCALLIEEGFSLNELKIILSSMAKECAKNGVKIVCGDTKVLPKGGCDGLFINTSGIGKIVASGICTSSLKVGSKILLSGDIARHGSVVMALRDEFALSSELQSDCKSLKSVVLELINSGIKPLCLRDATRGGISAVLNEWANFSGFEIALQEEKIKISDEVMGICELLGFEPYELANEGTFVLAIEPKDEEKALEILRSFDKNASCIGEIVSDKSTVVTITNPYGASRVLMPPRGELLPRIC
ncbi:MAG: hydrogenase expression/formation protein HypE [Campylobacter sp.]|nr:hydrogenase expression/formation protein HypE [Campylobacter sp.]